MIGMGLRSPATAARLAAPKAVGYSAADAWGRRSISTRPKTSCAAVNGAAELTDGQG